MERIGLVGLPNSGKTSLFNALTGASAPVAAHPFTTTETSVGVAHVPDPRLFALGLMSSSARCVEALVEVVDIAGLVAGADRGEGLGNRFLAGIREVDALCLVLRSFGDDRVPGESDPLAALGVLELELVLADLASIPGSLPDLRRADLPPCRYSARCERHAPDCDAGLLALALTGEHAVACRHPL